MDRRVVIFIAVVVAGALIAVFMGMRGDDSPSALPTATGAVMSEEEISQNNPLAVGGQFDESEQRIDQSNTVFEVIEEGAPIVESPKEIPNLVGWYTADSWQGDKWGDLSGQENTATEVNGEPQVEAEEGSDLKFLAGGKEDGVKFPVEAMTSGKKYTLFHVARFGSTDQYGRIFDGTTNNFLSGYIGHNNAPITGTAHRTGSGWISHWVAPGVEDVKKWNVSTDQKHTFRWNGVNRTGLTNFSAAIPRQLTINAGEHEQQRTAWNVGEVIIYRGELSIDDMVRVENYLLKKWGLRRPVRQPTHMHTIWSSGEGLEKLNEVGNSCGPEGGAYALSWNRHHSYNEAQEAWVPNGNRNVELYCLNGMKNGAVEYKETETVDYDSDKAWWENYQKFDIDCGDKPLNEVKWEDVNNRKVKMKYGCSSHNVNPNSCREEMIDVGKDLQADENAKDIGMMAALHNRGPDCGPHRVLTKNELVDDEGTLKWKFRCCALEDE